LCRAMTRMVLVRFTKAPSDFSSALL